MTRRVERIDQLRKGQLTDTQARIAEILTGGPHGVADLQPLLGLSPSGIRKALTEMRDAGIVEQIGGRGQRTVYQLAS
ncbi:winged helix-turn-helix domain-containing protein [Nocardia sp. NBC_01388]|uniref:winged helix-turn-helix domain-containing protein n=1 Tax=Nocardia sp. NBC_01388 TaxID=2903596 RepID=UPI0032498FC5